MYYFGLKKKEYVFCEGKNGRGDILKWWFGLKVFKRFYFFIKVMLYVCVFEVLFGNIICSWFLFWGWFLGNCYYVYYFR